MLRSHPESGFEPGNGHPGFILSATLAEAWDLLKSIKRIYLGTRWLRLHLENEEQDLRRGRES